MKKKEFDNEDRTRYYGLRVGDIVGTYSVTGGKRPKAVVIGYGFLDNNRVTVRMEDGTERDEVAEWCELITKVEDKFFLNGETVITPVGKAVIEKIDNIDKAVRVKHLEAKTPVTDYRFADLLK
jgi:hypothetical protein